MYLILKKKNREITKYLYSESLLELNQQIISNSEFSHFVEATLHSYDEVLSCYDLLELKNLLTQLNIELKNVFSNRRDSLITAKALKIEGIHSDADFNKLNHTYNSAENLENLTHIGMIRSGDKISSNGNLIIIGDVNPGAQISARENIYVWGKLCGIAIAGISGDDTCEIASLYLNPLQLRINNTVAIGPKEKPLNHYPEIALLEFGRIVIKPLLVNI